jgi:purine nucleosidase
VRVATWNVEHAVRARDGVVDVELAGSLTRAMTVVDWDGLWGRPPNAEVAVDVAYERFVQGLISALGRLDRATGAPQPA